MVKHSFQSAKSDGADATLVRPSPWNDDHTWDGGIDTAILIRDTGQAKGGSWMTVDASTLLITGATGARVLKAAQQIPSGALVPYAGAVAPSGWLVCDGAAVSRVTYAALFIAIGTTYGAGDGSTTFTLPDLRGRAVFGTGAGPSLTPRALGAAGGEESHVLTVAEMPPHQHEVPISQATFGAGNPLSGTFGANPNVSTTSTGGGAGHNTMPPFLCVNYLIKT